MQQLAGRAGFGLADILTQCLHIKEAEGAGEDEGAGGAEEVEQGAPAEQSESGSKA